MNVLFRRGDQTFIDNNVPLNDGQIIFNETDEAIYVDNTINGTVVRKRYGGGNLSRSDIDMAFSTTSENPIANKVVTNAIGTLSNLTTDVKTNLVGAINEVDGHADTAIDNANTNASHIGTLSNLTTTAKNNLVMAVNEVNTKVFKTEDLIAYVQTSLTASKNYAVGEQFVYNGLLYKATATIAQGGTITIGGNCELADSVTKQIDNKWIIEEIQCDYATIASNTYGKCSFTLYKAGYTAVMITCKTANSVDAFYVGCDSYNIVNNNAYMRNVSNNQITINPVMNVLWKKN